MIKGLKIKGLIFVCVRSTYAFLLLFTPAFLCSPQAFATLSVGLGMDEIEHNVVGALQGVAGIIHAVAILGGIAFFVAFAFKTKQHRDNPTQVTIGQPLMYLFLAISLTMLPSFISTSKHAVYGDSQVSQWDGSQMDKLFGSKLASNTVRPNDIENVDDIDDSDGIVTG